MKENYILDKNLVLVALLGGSPAIITETLWALASLDEPLIPKRVEIYTTSDCLEKWKTFNKDNIEDCKKEIQKIANVKFKESEDIDFYINLIGGSKNPFTDIRTKEENEIMSDFFFEKIQTLKKEKRRLLISIAGGRKTMSTMLHSVASILCSSEDKIYHILTNPGDPRDLPEGFAFPKLLENGKYDVDLDLAEIPFIPLSEYLSTKDFVGIHSYNNFMEKLSSKLDATSFKVYMNLSKNKIKIQAKETYEFKLSNTYFILVSTLLRRTKTGSTEKSIKLSPFSWEKKIYSEAEISELSPFYQDLLKERKLIEGMSAYQKNNLIDKRIELDVKVDDNPKENAFDVKFKISDNLGNIRQKFRESKRSLSENIIDKILPDFRKSHNSLIEPENIFFEDY